MFKIICDFDGVIAVTNVFVRLLEEFALSQWRVIEQDWLEGRISARERLSCQVALIRAHSYEMVRFCHNIEIDPTFPAFTEFCNARQFPILVVSNGLDLLVQQALARRGLGHLLIIANQLKQRGEDHWQVTFPYRVTRCWRGTGVCQSTVTLTHTKPVVFIGDGRSDRCFVRQADLVLAKGSLVHYCLRHDIAHLAVDSFADALLILQQLSSDSSIERVVYH